MGVADQHEACCEFVLRDLSLVADGVCSTVRAFWEFYFRGTTRGPARRIETGRRSRDPRLRAKYRR